MMGLFFLPLRPCMEFLTLLLLVGANGLTSPKPLCLVVDPGMLGRRIEERCEVSSLWSCNFRLVPCVGGELW